jgi:hypothetical protein
MDGSMFYFHPMGCKSNRFSSFLLKLRKEADDREAPGGLFQPVHTSLRFCVYPSNPIACRRHSHVKFLSLF